MIYWAQIIECFEKVPKLPWRGGIVAAFAGFMTASLAALGVQFFLFSQSESIVLTRSGQRALSLSPVEPGFKSGSTLDRAGIETILNRNLFNKDGVLEEEKDSDEDDVEEDLGKSSIPKSELDIKILGIIYGGSPTSGAVTLQNRSSGQITTFLADEFVTGDAQLKEILQDRIIVFRNSRLEYIEVEQPPDSKKQRRRGRSVGVKTVAPISKSGLDKFSEPGFERSGNEITLSSDYRKKLLTADFTKVLQDAKAEPNLVGGELDGFRLTRIRADSIYEKSGLQNGDVIKEINGVSLVDTAQTIKLLNSLRSAAEIEVRINRGSANFVKVISVR